jgi:hypothetical protein
MINDLNKGNVIHTQANLKIKITNKPKVSESIGIQRMS